MFCHSRAAGFVLGLTTPQMNRDHKYDAAVDNQLRTLSHIGIFKKELPKPPAEYPAYPDPLNPNADLTARVKTYLQVNCSMCHVADGGGNSLIDLAYKTPLDKARMLNEPRFTRASPLPKRGLSRPAMRSVRCCITESAIAAQAKCLRPAPIASTMLERGSSASGLTSSLSACPRVTPAGSMYREVRDKKFAAGRFRCASSRRGTRTASTECRWSEESSRQDRAAYH